MMGQIVVATTVREDTREGATGLVRACATVVPDDGTDDPLEFARDALTAACEAWHDLV